MPIYDYDCPHHGEFEAAVTFKNADKPQPCPVTVGGCKDRKHRIDRMHRHTLYACGVPCKRMARLYVPGISYCDGMTKHPAVIDSENTRKHGHTV
jgi:putative FmdB family regulatory protein